MTLLLMQCSVMLSHGVIDVGTILLADEQLVYVLEAVQGIISVTEHEGTATLVQYVIMPFISQESHFLSRFDFSACMSLFTVH